MRNLWTALLYIAISSTAHAGLDEGKAAYARQDYSAAMNELQPVAEQGNVEAQYYIGYIYQNGQGVNEDQQQAAKWYLKAANGGYGPAQSKIGFMYANGHAFTKDYEKAAIWYRKAAEQGNLTGQKELGVLYFNGNGVKKDYAQAKNWLQKAADQGDTWAKSALQQVTQQEQIDIGTQKLDKLKFRSEFLASTIYVNYLGQWAQLMPTKAWLALVLSNKEIISIQEISAAANPGVSVKRVGQPATSIIFRMEGSEAYVHAIGSEGRIQVIRSAADHSQVTLIIKNMAGLIN